MPGDVLSASCLVVLLLLSWLRSLESILHRDPHPPPPALRDFDQAKVPNHAGGWRVAPQESPEILSILCLPYC